MCFAGPRSRIVSEVFFELFIFILYSVNRDCGLLHVIFLMVDSLKEISTSLCWVVEKQCYLANIVTLGACNARMLPKNWIRGGRGSFPYARQES